MTYPENEDKGGLIASVCFLMAIAVLILLAVVFL
jgi:hypothetical protein